MMKYFMYSCEMDHITDFCRFMIWNLDNSYTFEELKNDVRKDVPCFIENEVFNKHEYDSFGRIIYIGSNAEWTFKSNLDMIQLKKRFEEANQQIENLDAIINTIKSLHS